MSNTISNSEPEVLEDANIQVEISNAEQDSVAEENTNNNTPNDVNQEEHQDALPNISAEEVMSDTESDVNSNNHQELPHMTQYMRDLLILNSLRDYDSDSEDQVSNCSQNNKLNFLGFPTYLFPIFDNPDELFEISFQSQNFLDDNNQAVQSATSNDSSNDYTVLDDLTESDASSGSLLGQEIRSRAAATISNNLNRNNASTSTNRNTQDTDLTDSDSVSSYDSLIYGSTEE